MRFLGHLIVTGLALWVTALILPGMHLGDDSATLLSQVLTIGAIALILALINTIVKPLLSFLAFPITCLTLGLFQLVINTLMLLLAGWVSGLVGLTLEFDTGQSETITAMVKEFTEEEDHYHSPTATP